MEREMGEKTEVLMGPAGESEEGSKQWAGRGDGVTGMVKAARVDQTRHYSTGPDDHSNCFSIANYYYYHDDDLIMHYSSYGLFAL